jgi:hypothetical protein
VKLGGIFSDFLTGSTAYQSSGRQIGAQYLEAAALAGVGMKVRVASGTDVLIEVDYSRGFDSIFNSTTDYRSDLGASIGVALNL